MFVNCKSCFAVGTDTGSKYCVPFVSQYTDCTEDNLCSGCSKCICTAEGKWDCENIQDCPTPVKNTITFKDTDIQKALTILQNELSDHDKSVKAASKHRNVPEPEDNKVDDILLEVKEASMEDEILKLLKRTKRSADDTVKGGKKNDTITFYHTIDELNEDTLTKQNLSGTITAKKLDALPTRRSSMYNNETSSAIQIEYPSQKEHAHRDDNKVDTLAIHDDKEDLLVHSSIHSSQGIKDKELSKIVVNELKGGVAEIIGDKKAPVISNITFTPENDTLTAMAFIAGNLLNKLWNMEKGASDNIDTEVLKHEKIANLLDLFKEPLNIRQEMFLKNSLEQLSKALTQNENVENMSLCKNIAQAKKSLDGKRNNENVEVKSDCHKKSPANQNTATAEALNKINDVLGLIKKYENVQDSLINNKFRKASNIVKTNNGNMGKKLTEEEKSSLDLYGQTLGALTKLLIPGKKNKTIKNSIENSYLYNTGKSLEKKLFDVNLANINVTTKDKMVLDYISHIQSNPDCLLKKQNEKLSLRSVEGSILLNLSEFFKIKSMSDLMKLLETEKHPESDIDPEEVTTQTTIKEKIINTKNSNPKQFKDKKEKLRGHLKAFLEDLIELQKVDGKDTKNVQITEILPCIYNILNAGKAKSKMPKLSLEDKTTPVLISPSERLQQTLSNLKKELKSDQSRRTDTFSGPRPKSAVVWERVLKNAESKQKLKSRRNFVETPKSIEELKFMMRKIESLESNTYKNYAYLNEVPAAERLLLLKTFIADTVQYIKALEQVNLALQDKPYISNEVAKEVNEFLDNAAMNVNLNEKVVKNLDTPENIKSFVNTAVSSNKSKTSFKYKQPVNQEQSSYITKLTRDQVINQVIKNRVLLYIETKEATHETRNDMSYDIAKQILFHLQVGNDKIARELYDMLTNARKKNLRTEENILVNPDPNIEQMSRGFESRRYQVEPLIKFEEPKAMNKVLMSQDHFIKQLLNLKNKF